MAGDDEARPARARSGQGDHERIDYNFRVEIVVRLPAIDDKRVRQIVDEEFQRLTAAIKNAR
jgi:hypothetical protein